MLPTSLEYTKRTCVGLYVCTELGLQLKTAQPLTQFTITIYCAAGLKQHNKCNCWHVARGLGGYLQHPPGNRLAT